MASAVANSQVVSPSQVTPHSLRPASAPEGTISIVTAAGLTPPPNAANLSVTLSDVVVDGGFPELQDKTAALMAPIRGKHVTVADIYVAANALEQAYAAEGYILARVVVPPQKLNNGGVLRLVVVDGFIEAVDVKGVAQSQQALVAARLASLVGRRHVKIADIERRLLLAAQVPGITISSTLSRGATPGGALLVLEGTYNAVSGAFGFDNYLPNSLGRSELNGSIALNSVLGFGEQLYGSATTGYNIGQAFSGASPIQVLGGGFSLPIGVDGLTINPEYTNSITRPLPEAGTPVSSGYFQRFDLRLGYPVILTRAQILTVQAAYEWDDEYLVPLGFGSDLYWDNYSVARLQAEDRLQLPIGALADVILAYSQGLGGREAPQTAAAVPLSQQGASPTFSKLALNARWSQPLPAEFQATLIGRAQTSFGKPLFIAEQFLLDGPNALSGFPLGTFSVDEGATLRGELSRPFPIAFPAVQATVAPYVFAAGGRGRIDDPTAAQQAIVDAGSLGVGFHTGAGVTGTPYGGSFSVELARFFSNVVGEGQGYRGNVTFSVSF